MSFEQFKSLSPEDHAGATEHTVKEKGVSPTEAFAQRLIEAGSSALKMYANSHMDHSTRTLYLTPDFYNGLYTKNSANLGAIVTGTSVIAVHRALEDKRFSTKQHCDYWNSQVTGLPFLLADHPYEDEVEEFTNEQWREMVALAKIDPSLISFFTKDYRHLRPTGLEHFIADNTFRGHMKKTLSTFHMVANSNAPTMLLSSIQIAERQHQLEGFDAAISAVQARIDNSKEIVLGGVIAKQQAEIDASRPEIMDEFLL